MRIVLQKLKQTTKVEEKNSSQVEHMKVETESIKSERDEFKHDEDGIVDVEMKQNNESNELIQGLEIVDMRNSSGVDCSSLEEHKTKDVEAKPSMICIVEPPTKTKRSRKKIQKVEIIEQPLEKKTKATKRKSTSQSKSNAKRKKTTKDTTADLDSKKSVTGRPKRASAVKAGENFTLLKAWYDGCLSEMSTRTERSRSFQRQSDFQCCCVSEVVSDNVVECPKCRTWQHAECVGYDETSADYEYYCFRCWVDIPPLISSGTVIISPEAISQQWVSEVRLSVYSLAYLSIPSKVIGIANKIINIYCRTTY